MKLVYALAIATGAMLAMPASAQTAKDSVTTQSGSHAISSNGECVRTKWSAANDPCAPEPPPAPKTVAAPPPPPPPTISLEQRTLYFGFNESELRPEGVAKLDSLIDIILRSKGIQRATVIGYADEIGDAEDNIALSQKRASSVEQYMATRVKIPTNVLLVNGKGATDSVTDCPKQMKRKERIECLAKDRRVEVEFNYAH